MKTLLLVDGHALTHRAFFALPPFKTSQGVPTNAIYGFLTMLYKALTDFNPDYLAICYDTPKPTFRQKLFKEYQIQRPPTAGELKTQIPILKEVLKKGGIFQAEKEGYEADDVIGTLTKVAKDKGLKVLILTGDRDIMQLIDGNIFVVTPQIGFSKTIIFDRQKVVERYGIQPEQVADYKALVGDQSDNYPGIRGVGPKTAIELLQQFGSIENMLKQIDKIENEKLKKLIVDNKKELELSKKLSYLVTDVNVKFDLNSAKFAGFKKAMKGELLKLEMRSIASRFFDSKKPEPPKKVIEKKKELPQEDTLF